MTARGFVPPFAAGAAVFLAAACCHPPRDWNSAARLTQAYALGQLGRLDSTPLLAPAAETLGPSAAAAVVRQRGPEFLLPEHPPTRDIAFAGGRYWCEKAPGQSLLAAAGLRLALMCGATPHPVPTVAAPLDPAAMSLFRTDYWLTLLSSGACAAALAALFCRTLQQAGAAPGAAAAAAVACVLATPLFPYATLCYGHLAAGWWLALAALWLHCGPAGTMHAAAAGLAAGAAAATEYTLAPVVMLAAAGLWRTPSRVAAFVAGGLPIAAALGWYHWRITGNPIVPPYRYVFFAEFAAVHRQGSGIPLGIPSLEALRELLVGTRRGLLWHALPVWAAAPGLWHLAKSRRGLAWLCGGGFVALLLTVAAFPKWDGGLAAGPRFLVPGMPLLLWPAAWWATTRAAAWPRRVWWAAAVLGAVAMACLNAAGASVPPAVNSWDFVRHGLDANAVRHAGHWLLGLGAGAYPALAILLAGLAAVAAGAILVARRWGR